MPRQNRPLVRDGRLQAAKKKRTDRRYLGAASPQSEETNDRPLTDEESAEDVAQPVEEDGAFGEPAHRGAAVSAHDQVVRQGERNRASQLPSSARALQRQGVRRRELDVDALAERDSRYALHEIRRILILTTMVIVTLIVLGVVLR